MTQFQATLGKQNFTQHVKIGLPDTEALGPKYHNLALNGTYD